MNVVTERRGQAGRLDGEAELDVVVDAAGGSRSGRPAAVRRTGGLIGFAAAVALLVVIWTFAPPFWIDIANLAFIAAIGALGLDLLLGHTGLVSVGNAAFIGIGATTVALLNQSDPKPMIPCLLIAGAVCAVIGVVVSLPSLRITGLYLAIATLAFHFIAVWAIREIQTDRVGDTGFAIPVAEFFGITLLPLRNWFVFLSIVLVLVVVLRRGLLLRKPGRALHAIRERPALASMSGVVVWRTKGLAFAISSFTVGVAGGLTAYYIGNVSYANFTLHLAIMNLAMVIVGGLGSMYGPVAGAIFITALPHLVEEARDRFGLEGVISNSDIFFVEGAVVGIAVVALIVLQPKGLSAVGSGLRDLFVRRIARRSAR